MDGVVRWRQLLIVTGSTETFTENDRSESTNVYC